MLILLHRSPSCEILRVHGDCNRQQGELQKSNIFLSFLETLAIEGEIHGYHSFKYQAYDKSKCISCYNSILNQINTLKYKILKIFVII